MKQKERLIVVDILKIVCALFIFLRHAASMGGCNIPFFGDFVYSVTSPIMTVFFMASGFSMYYVYGEKQLCNKEQLMPFYKKRAISILPVYFFVHIVYSFFYEYDPEVVWKLMPLNTVGVQSWYTSLF